MSDNIQTTKVTISQRTEAWKYSHDLLNNHSLPSTGSIQHKLVTWLKNNNPEKIDDGDYIIKDSKITIPERKQDVVYIISKAVSMNASQKDYYDEKYNIVKSISGPKTIEDAIYAEFKVSEYRFPEVNSKEKEQIKWRIKIGTEIKEIIIPKGIKNYGSIEGNYRIRSKAYTGETLKLEITEEMFIPFKKKGSNKNKIKIIAYGIVLSEDVEFEVTLNWSEVGYCISLIRQIEIINPHWNSETVINCLRRIGGYDDLKFRVLYGQGTKKLPQDGSGANPLILGERLHVKYNSIENSLKFFLMHQGNQVGNETGIADEKPFYDNKVTIGHVCTGISGGFHRKKIYDFGYEYAMAKKSEIYNKGNIVKKGLIIATDPLTNGYAATVGDKIDNLYTATIAGDIGQQANILNEFKTDKKTAAKIGYGTEATFAELIGDIDGFNIGNNISKYKNKSISEILDSYYSNISKDTVHRKKRFSIFEKQGLKDLLKESKSFATNYAYAHRGKVTGVTSVLGEEVELVYNAFLSWFKSKKAGEK